MIIKDTFSVTIGQHVINEFVYEIERSKENEKEVSFCSYTTNSGKESARMTFETEKDDEEIIAFFKEKHAFYKEEIAKKWFFLKSVPIVKFSKEIEIFLSKK